MERFYQLLKQYNIKFSDGRFDLPEWFFQYTDNSPPIYWSMVYQNLKNVDRNKTIVEIGAGYGDVTALLYFMGFRKIICFEVNSSIIEYVKYKIKTLFNSEVNIRNERYPVKLEFTPDILIQVNCVYSDLIRRKVDYLKQIRINYVINGLPEMFIFECIDDSYDQENDVFPQFIRLSKDEVSNLFPQCSIESFSTYKYPINKVSKTLYRICK